jgi:hypothetical protein
LQKGPRYLATFVAWQARRWARRRGLLPRPWRIGPAAIWSQLDGDNPALTGVAAALNSNPGAGAETLLAYFRSRQVPRFFFRWDERDALSALVGPAARSATIAAADQAVQRTFRFRGQPPVTFDGAPDWAHRPQGNIDWMWDLNRHFYFVTLGQAFWYTGDARYARAFVELATDWLARNPADETQPNWTNPFEVACRVNTWLWAYFLFLQSDALDPGPHLNLLQGLWTHGAYLDACLELHVPNNHLLLEVKALAMLGLLLPEFKAARRWRQRGRHLLEREVARQVCADGVHIERVPHYHRLIAGELLEWLVLLDNNQQAAPPAFVDHCLRMFEFERDLTRPDGQIPLFGDSAHDDPHIRFVSAPGGAALFRRPDLKTPHRSLNEMTVWLLGPERVRQFQTLPAKPPAPSRCFPEGGYAVMRDRWAADSLYLALDCGPFGFDLAPKHGHADALSFELHARGHPQLVDAGVYSFHLGDRWRQTFRGTAAHNTVVVDGLDQSMLLDSGRVWRPARVTLNDWVTHPAFDFVDASHDGYRRLPDPMTHRRMILFVKPEYWLIVDWLEGLGAHTFEALFHFPPQSVVRLVPQTGAAATDDLFVVPCRRPGLTAATTEGWVSYRSGDKQPAPVVSHTLKASAPAGFQTLVCLRPASARSAPSVLDLSADIRSEMGQSVSRVVAVALELGNWRDIVILDGRPGLNRKRLGPYETDAVMTCLRCRPGESSPQRAFVRRGAFLAAESQPLLRRQHPVETEEIAVSGRPVEVIAEQMPHVV